MANLWKLLNAAWRMSRADRAKTEKALQAASDSDQAKGNRKKKDEDEHSLVGTDPRIELEANCYRLAYREARKSWELEPSEQTLLSQEAKGAALALTLHRPASKANDARKLEKFRMIEAEVKKHAAARDRAKAEAQTRDLELAALGAARAYPELPALLTHAAILALSVSIVPTLHDLFTGLDPFTRWLVGGAAAWGISLTIIHGLMPSGVAPEVEKEEEEEEDEQ